MSHELRTPLNAVLGLSEALIERVFGELNDMQVQTLETVHKSGRHLLELINDVLDIARVESGKLVVDLEQTGVRPLVDESTALMANILSGRNQRLVIELAPALPPVEIDKRRMRQVLINLLGNASKFSPPGSGITLRVTADSELREIAIAIADHGPGIPADDLHRIFEPFVSVSPILTRAHDGAGLGLALAKRIVELHRGRLVVSSEVGVGSTFTVVLPVAPTYVEPPPRPIRVHAPTRPGTVLLVEDNEATVLAVRTYLESRGFGIRVVGDGFTALSAAEEDDVVLVLMDIQLPGLDGLEVTRRLRARSFEKPIVALTAYAMPQDERRCLDAGASAYMPKPVRLRSLAATIDRLLEAR
jgi:CheY-like chemotaxis protein